MVIIKITDNRIDLQGHAINKQGTRCQPVCEAISAITQLGAGAMETVAGYRPYVAKEKGSMQIEIDKNAPAEAFLIFDMIKAELREYSRIWSEYITVENG